jgi:protein-S-isoprenylcysteine O-methyltransferase Ste14
MKQKYFIDSQKALTFIVVLILIVVYDQWQNQTAWIYMALHGTYGLLWGMKSRIFPDKSWEARASLGLGFVYWAGLTLFWITPYLIASRGVQVPAWYLGICVSMNIFGVFFHFVSDMQKFTTLKLRPGILITDGMMGRVRNLYYFGELLIYLGFGLLAMHWLPLVIVAAYVIFVWSYFMRRKDKSLSRYPEFEAYKKRTKYFIPFLW